MGPLTQVIQVLIFFNIGDASCALFCRCSHFVTSLHLRAGGKLTLVLGSGCGGGLRCQELLTNIMQGVVSPVDDGLLAVGRMEGRPLTRHQSF